MDSERCRKGYTALVGVVQQDWGIVFIPVAQLIENLPEAGGLLNALDERRNVHGRATAVQTCDS